MQPVGDVAVEGAGLHGDAVHSREGLVCDVEGLQHPEACRGKNNGVGKSSSAAKKGFC